MASHSSGVPQREVNVLAAVNVDNFVPVGLRKVRWEATCPLVHPCHRHSAEQIVCSVIGLKALGVQFSVEHSFAVDELLQFLGVEHYDSNVESL